MINLHSDDEKLDLHMNTGSTGVFENLPTFGMVGIANKSIEGGDIETYKRWLYSRPANYYNLQSLSRPTTTTYIIVVAPLLKHMRL